MNRLRTGGAACLLVVLSAGVADASLHARIDNLIETRDAGHNPVELVDDAGFARRVWLDLAGRIPAADQLRLFLADTSPDKRERLINELLSGDEYVEHMSDVLHILLMERRGDDASWRQFLTESVRQNKPWNVLTREIIDPDDSQESLRGAAYFYTKRLEKYGENPTDYAGLTRDVGRLFLGVDLQCAECHDHLFISDYTQREFQGLFAVYGNLAIRNGAGFPAVDLKPISSQREFVSVFDDTPQQTGPRVPFRGEIAIPATDSAAPTMDEPRLDPLALIAADLTAPDNERFAQNIVNRLWFAMMGRGLVEPLDMSHAENPATHPELLELLSTEFVEHDYDMQWLLRELALTRTYQRSTQHSSGDMTDMTEAVHSYTFAHEKRLSAEQLLRSMLVATGNLERMVDAAGNPTEARQTLTKEFVTAFANEPRDPEVDFGASVKGALFLLNDDAVLDLLEPREGNLTAQLLNEGDPDRLLENLFLSVFSRPPDEAEREAIGDYLEQTDDRRAESLQHLVWGMLTSMEFLVNH